MAEARYPIKIDSNAAEVGREGAAALESLRLKINDTQEAVRGYQSNLKLLRGTSEEVTVAKKKLTEQIAAEQSKLTSLGLTATRTGTSIAKLNSDAKKLDTQQKDLKVSTEKWDKEQKKLREDIEKTKLKKLADDEKALADRTKTASAEWAAFGSVLAIGTGLALAAAAGIGKIGASILSAGNELRKQQLDREGALGNPDDAKRLGDQIEALGKKVPQTRAELNQMALDLSKAGVSGSTLVDTLNAVAQANSGLAGAGDKLKESVERGRLTQRFAINPLELQGTGLKFADIAKSLAKNTKTSVNEAATALLQGQVPLGEGAKALKDAVEARFGKVNLAKMLDLDVIKSKLIDSAGALTSGVNLQPFLEGFSEIAGLLDQSSVSGKGLKSIVTFIGNEAGAAFKESVPGIKAFLLQLEIGALKLQGNYLDLKVAFHEAFAPLQGIGVDLDAYNEGVSIAHDVTDQWAASSFILQANMKMVSAEIQSIRDIGGAFEDAYDEVAGLDWVGLGKSIVDGILTPITFVPNKVSEIGGDIVTSLKSKLGIHSPSKLLADEIGKPSAMGIAQGIDQGLPQIDASIDATTSRMRNGAQGSGGGGDSIQLAVTLNYHGNAPMTEVEDFKTKVEAGVVLVLERWLQTRAMRPA